MSTFFTNYLNKIRFFTDVCVSSKCVHTQFEKPLPLVHFLYTWQTLPPPGVCMAFMDAPIVKVLFYYKF